MRWAGFGPIPDLATPRRRSHVRSLAQHGESVSEAEEFDQAFDRGRVEGDPIDAECGHAAACGGTTAVLPRYDGVACRPRKLVLPARAAAESGEAGLFDTVADTASVS